VMLYGLVTYVLRDNAVEAIFIDAEKAGYKNYTHRSYLWTPNTLARCKPLSKGGPCPVPLSGALAFGTQGSITTADAQPMHPWQATRWLLDHKVLLGEKAKLKSITPEVTKQLAAIVRLNGGTFEAGEPTSELGQISLWRFKRGNAERLLATTDNALFHYELEPGQNRLEVAVQAFGSSSSTPLLTVVADQEGLIRIACANDAVPVPGRPMPNPIALPHNVVFQTLFDDVESVAIPERADRETRYKTTAAIQANSCDSHCNGLCVDLRSSK
jgi:hypothetical protein